VGVTTLVGVVVGVTVALPVGVAVIARVGLGVTEAAVVGVAMGVVLVDDPALDPADDWLEAACWDELAVEASFSPPPPQATSPMPSKTGIHFLFIFVLPKKQGKYR
jgi:hypothetical protein